MREHQTQVRKTAEDLMKTGKARLFIGYTEGLEAARPVAFFLKDPERAGALVLNEFCGAGLAKYVLDEAVSPDALSGEPLPPVAIVAKGCDALGLERLMADNRVPRDELYIIGIACHGIVDPGKVLEVTGEEPVSAQVEKDHVAVMTTRGSHRLAKAGCLMDKCLTCEDPTPRVYDVLLGDPVQEGPAGKRDFSGVTQVESLSPDERYEFWARQFQRCLRCFACRNVCPACNCSVCSLDEREPEWLSRSTDLPEQFMFHFTRAYHVAGRCVACGECQRACPVGIPLMLLNEKFMKDIRDLFGEPAPHRPSEVEPLGKFCPDDPEGWLKEAETA
ncbi:MAG: Coenzyme F420 hydrogenase/dehydrogenase, beta subunit C-terminal domain [Bacillota bacterium]|jgi:ferredoxin